MANKKLTELAEWLGTEYTVRIIDKGEVVFCEIDGVYEFEIVPYGTTYTIYLWQRKPHTELMCIYSHIRSARDLKDTLGHLAFKCRKTADRIQVEREDLI